MEPKPYTICWACGDTTSGTHTACPICHSTDVSNVQLEESQVQNLDGVIDEDGWINYELDE